MVNASSGVHVYSLAFAVTHCAYLRTDDQAELTCVSGYIPRWFIHPQTSPIQVLTGYNVVPSQTATVNHIATKKHLTKHNNDETRCHAIAGSTVRCGCKFWYVGLSKFSVASRGFHCSSNAFELNNSMNHGKIRVFNIIYLLPHIVCHRSKCSNCT